MRYAGHKCVDYHIRATYSPDGRYVVVGSDDGTLFAWVEESGDLVFEGLPVGFHGPLLQIAWSHHDHVMTMCSYGAANPILTFFHDASSSQQLELAPSAPTGQQARPLNQAQAPRQTTREIDSGALERAAYVGGRSSAAFASSVGTDAPGPSVTAGSRINSAVRRARRNGNPPGDALLLGSLQSNRLPRPAESALVSADAEVLSARRKAAAAARRALASNPP